MGNLLPFAPSRPRTTHSPPPFLPTPPSQASASTPPPPGYRHALKRWTTLPASVAESSPDLQVISETPLPTPGLRHALKRWTTLPASTAESSPDLQVVAETPRPSPFVSRAPSPPLPAILPILRLHAPAAHPAAPSLAEAPAL